MRSRSQPCSRLLPAARPRSSRDKHALHAPHTYTRQARPPRAPHLYQTSTPSTRPTPTPHSPHAHCRRAAAHQHVCRGAVPGDDVDVAVVGRHRQHRLALRGARGGAAGRPGQARGTAQARRRGCTKQGRPAAAPGSSGGCCPPPPRLRLPPPPLTPPAPRVSQMRTVLSTEAEANTVSSVGLHCRSSTDDSWPLRACGTAAWRLRRGGELQGRHRRPAACPRWRAGGCAAHGWAAGRRSLAPHL